MKSVIALIDHSKAATGHKIPKAPGFREDRGHLDASQGTESGDFCLALHSVLQGVIEWAVL